MTQGSERHPGAVAVLSSGGVDSAVLVAELARRGCQVQPLYVRFGLAWEDVEEAHLRRFVAALDGAVPPGSVRSVVGLELPLADVYGDHWSLSGEDVPDAGSADDAVYLPGRNLLLLAKSSVWCALHGIEAIALGVLGGNPFPDSGREHMDGAAALVRLGLGVPFEVLTPFAGMAKAEVVELGRGLPLEHTFSCIHPVEGRHCGACNKCAERQAAFAALGLPDATVYAATPA